MPNDFQPNTLFDEEGRLRETGAQNAGKSFSLSRTPAAPEGRRNDGVVTADDIIRASRRAHGYGDPAAPAIPAAPAAPAPAPAPAIPVAPVAPAAPTTPKQNPVSAAPTAPVAPGARRETTAPAEHKEAPVAKDPQQAIPATEPEQKKNEPEAQTAQTEQPAAPAGDKPEPEAQVAPAESVPTEGVQIVTTPKKPRQVKKATLIAQQLKAGQEKGGEDAIPATGENKPEDDEKRAEMLEALKMKSIWEQLAYVQMNLHCPKARINDKNDRREYPYRTLGDVQLALAPLLADAGCVVVTDTECAQTPVWTGKTWDGIDDFRVRCDARVSIVNMRGDSITAKGYAHESVRLHDMLPAQVSAATQNYAIKQALIHLFNISDEAPGRTVVDVPDVDSMKGSTERPLQTSSAEMVELKRKARSWRGTADEFIASITGYTSKENQAVALLKALVDDNEFHTAAAG